MTDAKRSDDVSKLSSIVKSRRSRRSRRGPLFFNFYNMNCFVIMIGIFGLINSNRVYTNFFYSIHKLS